jgi:hypothetical protein
VKKLNNFKKLLKIITCNLNVYFNRANAIHILLVSLPLILAAITHLWNVVGFPVPQYDESIYLRRSMHVLEGQGAQESIPYTPYTLYDHPYFGQLFIASNLGIIGYPNSFNTSSDGNQSFIETSFFLPRLIIGILAVVDTFLIYKIAECRYNRKVALCASILFAVMPITWLARIVLLDTILLPLLLSSILFAVYYTKTILQTKRILLILLSGIFFGLAIFTKVPTFTMIPLLGFIIYNKNSRSIRILGLWIIPVILIPVIWPAYALITGHFDLWLNGTVWQTHRNVQGKPGILLPDTIRTFFSIDPVLLILSIAGILFAIGNRDLFVLLWIIPLLIFLWFIGWVQIFHILPILPAFCIAAAKLIVYVFFRLRNKIAYKILLTCIIIIGVAIYTLINTFTGITINYTSPYFKTAALFVQFLENNNKSITENNNKITILASHFYSWAFQLFHLKYNFKIYEEPLDLRAPPQKAVFIADPFVIEVLSKSPELEKATNLYNKSLLATIDNAVSIYQYDPKERVPSLVSYNSAIKNIVSLHGNRTLWSKPISDYNVRAISSQNLSLDNLPYSTNNMTSILKGNETIWSNTIPLNNTNYIESTFRVTDEYRNNQNHSGIVWKDGNNKEYYLFLRPDAISIYTPQEGEFLSAPLIENREIGKWFTLKVVYTNNTINIFLDNIPKIQIPNVAANNNNNNNASQTISKVGIRSFNNVAEFKPLKVGSAAIQQQGVNYAEIKLRTIGQSKQTDNHFGLTWNDDQKEYYAFLRQDRLSVFTPVDGEFLSTKLVPPREKGTWYTLKIVYTDHTIKIFLNDVLKLQTLKIPSKINNHITAIGIRSYNSDAEFGPMKVGRVSKLDTIDSQSTLELLRVLTNKKM